MSGTVTVGSATLSGGGSTWTCSIVPAEGLGASAVALSNADSLLAPAMFEFLSSFVGRSATAVQGTAPTIIFAASAACLALASVNGRPFSPGFTMPADMDNWWDLALLFSALSLTHFNFADGGLKPGRGQKLLYPAGIYLP